MQASSESLLRPKKSEHILSPVICEGDTVLLELNGEAYVLGRAVPGGKSRIGRVQISTAALIGQPWGAFFDAEGGKLRRTSERPYAENVVVECAEDDEERTNAGIVDNNQSQTLTQKEVEELKQSGASVSTILDKVTKGSTTFEKKTAFSQEKYLKRKQRKYKHIVRSVRPTGASLARMLYKKHSKRICEMRPDLLAILLNMANVQHLNITAEQRDVLQSIPLGQYFPLAKAEELRAEDAAAACLCQGIDSLIVATRYDPQDMFLEMLEALAPSRPFVVFSPYREPLIKILKHFKDHGGATNVSLHDTFTRDMQVLPSRTRPIMNLGSADSGFLLHGLRTLDKEVDRDAEDGGANEGGDAAAEPDEKRARIDA